MFSQERTDDIYSGSHWRRRRQKFRTWCPIDDRSVADFMAGIADNGEDGVDDFLS